MSGLTQRLDDTSDEWDTGVIVADLKARARADSDRRKAERERQAALERRVERLEDEFDCCLLVLDDGEQRNSGLPHVLNQVAVWLKFAVVLQRLVGAVCVSYLAARCLKVLVCHRLIVARRRPTTVQGRAL